MYRTYACCLGTLLIAAAVCRAQEYETAPDWMLPLQAAQYEPIQDKKTEPEPIAAPQVDVASSPDITTDYVEHEIVEQPCCDCCIPCCDSAAKCWVSADFLLWWIKDGPLPPLAVIQRTSTPDSVVVGQTGLEYGMFGGGRARAGYWIGNSVGIEASGFLLEDRTSTQQAFQDDTSISLDIPLLNGGLIDLFPDVSIIAASRAEFWGGQCNALLNFHRSCGCQIDFITGFRYLELNEQLLYLVSSENSIVPGTSMDHFSTQNQFFGGQIGARANLQRGRLSGMAVAKVALGSNQQIIDISGSNDTNPARAGIFAQGSNIGRHTSDEFAVIPEIQLRVRIALTKKIHASAGYDLIYWSKVVRPGDQIVRVFTPPNGGSPGVPFDESDFWAQGVSFGLEGRW